MIWVRQRNKSQNPGLVLTTSEYDSTGSVVSDCLEGLSTMFSKPAGDIAYWRDGQLFEKAIVKIFNQNEDTGVVMHDDLARIVNNGLRRRPNEDAVLNLAKQYARPDNMPNLSVLKTNPVMSERMRKGAKVVDAALQKIQVVSLKSMVSVLYATVCLLRALYTHHTINDRRFQLF